MIIKRSLVTAALLLSACSEMASPDADATERFASNAPESIETLLTDRAEHYGLSAASITVLDDSDTPRTYLIGDASPDGLMQAASLSKAVAAAGILTLMEREGIDIDADIRDRFASIDIHSIPGGDQPLTVRELLSHTAGATQSGFPGYRRGKALPDSATIVTDPPSLVLSPVEFSLPKGRFRYSGGGYQIAQVLAEDISGKPFAELMRDLLLDPLGMTTSTFRQPIEPEAVAPLTIVPANSGRRFREGLFRPLKDDWLDYPEQAAAGLWTTSADYARFVRAVMEAADGQPSPVSPGVARAMLTPVSETTFGEEGRQYGLGIALQTDADGKVTALSHSGLNAGYRALFQADPRSGRAVVSLSNAPGGVAFNREAVDGLMQNPAFTQP